jgi:hypothetical protein
MSVVKIVVARYNESLSWLNEYPFNQFEYIVYNKGDNDAFEKNHVTQIVKLANIGRCDHTYLYHIIKNYECLDDITVFLTGSAGHIPSKKQTAITILNNIIQSNYKNAYFIGVHYNSIKQHHADFKLDYYICQSPENFNKTRRSELLPCNIRPYYKWYNFFFGNITAHWCTYGGIFSIDKRDIIQHPKSNYQRIIQSVQTHFNPEAGHYIERSWGVIFYPLIYTIKIGTHEHTAPKVMQITAPKNRLSNRNKRLFKRVYINRPRRRVNRLRRRY